jgi:predicted DCC family thiol-disulfide oxidoreductase YuxK
LAPRDRGGRFWFATVQSETGQAVLKHRRMPTEVWDSFVLVEDG